MFIIVTSKNKHMLKSLKLKGLAVDNYVIFDEKTNTVRVTTNNEELKGHKPKDVYSLITRAKKTKAEVRANNLVCPTNFTKIHVN